MNNKILKITQDLINNIAISEGTEYWERSKLYIETYIFTCSLDLIYKKAKGEKVKDFNGYLLSYKQLFKEFLYYYLCIGIDPKIKLYAYNVLFSIRTRDLVLSLFEAIFTKEERDEIAFKLNYIPYSKIEDNFTKFYILSLGIKNKYIY